MLLTDFFENNAGINQMKKWNFFILKQMVELNSWTKNKKGVDAVGALMASEFQKLGFNSVCFSRECVGHHRFFQSSIIKNKPRWLLLGHLDTVFPPNTFEGFREDEEWIYGPGVCDMKGGNFVALQALKNIHTEYGSIANVDVLLVSDEETGSDDSRSVTTELAKNYDLCLDFEAAGKDHEVVIGRKGVATFQITLKGQAAHAGNHYSDGINANLAAAKMLVALTQLTDLEAGSTVNVGKIEGGIGANTISPYAHLSVEMRFTQECEKERLLNQISRICGTEWVEGLVIECEGGVQRDVMTSNDAQLQWLSCFEAVLGYPLKTEYRGGVSDANTVAGMGVATLDGFGPYGDGDHSVNERALKSSFDRRIQEVSVLLHYHRKLCES